MLGLLPPLSTRTTNPRLLIASDDLIAKFFRSRERRARAFPLLLAVYRFSAASEYFAALNQGCEAEKKGNLLSRAFCCISFSICVPASRQSRQARTRTSAASFRRFAGCIWSDRNRGIAKRRVRSLKGRGSLGHRVHGTCHRLMRPCVGEGAANADTRRREM